MDDAILKKGQTTPIEEVIDKAMTPSQNVGKLNVIYHGNSVINSESSNIDSRIVKISNYSRVLNKQ